MKWEPEGLTLGTPYLTLRVPGVVIYLEPRPAYCDRGRWKALVEPDDTPQGRQLALSLDYADMFPRYYFDLDRAKLELEAWVRAREELQDSAEEA